MKITNTNQLIINKPELSKANTADNLAGKKKSDSKVDVAQSAAIKTDTVQLSQKSIDLARAAKSDSGSRAGDTNKQVKADGKTQPNTVENMDENVLAKLLKMADKRSVIFGSSGVDASKESGGKIDYYL
ncbi:MAG: hypothetical protein ACUZ8I_06045 [Candidatus Scalindua sp.]